VVRRVIIILPNRLANYQKDWVAGMFRLLQGHRDTCVSDYAAMRLAADLTGGSASIVLTEFGNSYMKIFP
jgi:hypothetical protein